MDMRRKKILIEKVIEARGICRWKRHAYALQRQHFRSGDIHSGSLHEWEKPGAVFAEILRVLKPNGQFFVSDLKRDAPWYSRTLMFLLVKPKTMKPGLITSLNASYTYNEIHQILCSSGWNNPKISQNPFGLNILGKKAV
jgi:SAM-dependent methyltransferase